jgi:hypothetical protein
MWKKNPEKNPEKNRENALLEKIQSHFLELFFFWSSYMTDLLWSYNIEKDEKLFIT